MEEERQLVTLGQIAYEAYFKFSDGKSLISGAPLPNWGAQADKIKQAWEAAAEAAVDTHVRAALA
jgi:hypothetical protein